VLERVARGEAVDPASYYFRVAGSFETASPELAWLNTVVAVAVGSRSPTGPAYEVFELLWSPSFERRQLGPHNIPIDIAYCGVLAGGDCVITRCPYKRA
jgi:hypothetical protein